MIEYEVVLNFVDFNNNIIQSRITITVWTTMEVFPEDTLTMVDYIRKNINEIFVKKPFFYWCAEYNMAFNKHYHKEASSTSFTLLSSSSVRDTILILMIQHYKIAAYFYCS